ncbi:MAG: glycine/sarcosine/betaine reductase complex component C subunit beta [Tissierella sp.]|uniref:glycine/sarcosine/betaine reductase complex component C subunit beta n=1 Tax=Tissierella sp. TaxID=41274 RepID=UPI003F95F3E6
MKYSVVKGSSYVLIHAPDMLIHNGTTQTTEKQTNPDSKYLKDLPNHLRSFDEVVNYLPNQVYIGNHKPKELREYEQPWFDKKIDDVKKDGKFGEILAQEEFIGLVKIVDVFDLVKLTKEFTESVRVKLNNHPLISEELVSRLKEGTNIEEVEKIISEQGGEAIYNNGELIGCVKRAHDIDVNLTSTVLFENLVAKASAVITALNLIDKNDINPEEIDYVIECSEEACGDMNQRGGGNFAKAIAEFAGLTNATGSDTRGFCAAPAHSLVVASSLVAAGTFKNVMVVGGGSVAKLGMNGKDHIKKGVPVLEDVLAGFATLVSQDDGINPVFRTDMVGRHTVGTGSSPQAVITSLVTEPLDRNDLKITDIDKYSVEMQNPDITKPAGAGDVPTANYKMIAALGVKRGDLERRDIPRFIEEHGMEGWAPTQGHIPSGVPYLGFARDEILEGNIGKAMFVGKGSLFLGRMTNLFDGISIVLSKNEGKKEEAEGLSEEKVRGLVAEAMKDFASHLLKE